ncbi:amiloride-sensitive sodium channel subunit gamma-2 [Patella vulgata]|uniref:amiloride-sensitive sodium channel subunit gamma-2 n=1 Tax=Patella vulgata TaxID=6465 RepID=UPI00218090EF|nr:amiloride-sensitive sodium channel subunit gamma-2 [Patella vulgata]
MSSFDSSDTPTPQNKSGKSLKKIVKSFAERTSMQGVPNINNSKHWFQKLIWSVLLVGSMVAMTFHLKFLFDTYYAWPKHSTVSLGFNSLEFPAVTICNVNPIRQSKIHLGSAALRNIVSVTSPENIVKKMNERKHLRTSRNAKPKRKKESESEETEDGNIRKGSTEAATSLLTEGFSTMVTEETTRHKSTTEYLSTMAIEETTSQKSTTEYLPTATSAGVGDERGSADKGSTELVNEEGGEEIGLVNTVNLKPKQPENKDIILLPHTTTTEKPTITVEPIIPTEKPTTTTKKTTKTTRKPTEKLTMTTETPTTTTENQPNTTQIDNSNSQNSAEELSSKGAKTKLAAKNIQFQMVESKNGIKLLNDIELDFQNVRKQVKAEMESEGDAEATSLALPQQSMMSQIIEEFQYLFSQEQRSVRVAMGHQLDDMLVDCSFGGRICHPQNFSLRATTGLGNCFTLQHKGLVAQTSGLQEGMQLVIYLENGEYLRGLTSGNGGQIVIHDRDSCPFPQNDGIAIASGTESNIGLRLVNIERLGLPHGTCEEGDLFKEQYGFKYTRQACQVFCLQTLISSICKCYDEDEEELNIIAHIQEHYDPCRNISEIRCMLNIQRDYEKGEQKCECDNPCIETRYQHTISARQWPSDEYTNILLTALCEKKSPEECQRLRNMEPRELANNFLKINIYYEDLNYENITEEEDYETSQFISDVGGTIGLWVGLSMLSMFEVVEFVVQILQFFTFSLWFRKKPKTTKENTQLSTHHKTWDGL